LRENGYHLTGYGASSGDLASASKAGTRLAVSAVPPIFINVRRSISCPGIINSSVVYQKPVIIFPMVDGIGRLGVDFLLSYPRRDCRESCRCVLSGFSVNIGHSSFCLISRTASPAPPRFASFISEYL